MPCISDIATYNPITYMFAVLRALIVTGWSLRPIAEGLGALVGIGIASMSLLLLALRSRLRSP